MEQVRRVEKPDLQHFYEEYIVRGQPAILCGEMAWDIMSVDPHHFFPHEMGINVIVNKGDRNNEPRRACVPFGQLLSMWESSRDRDAEYYIAQYPVGMISQKLMDSLGYPRFIERALLAGVNLWMGQGGTPWHFDGVDNFLAQVRGSKSVRLLSPENLPYMYVFGGQWSALDDLDQIDLQTFPLSKSIGTPIEAVLNRGDMLFIPAGWWHSTSTLGDWGASLNFFFDTWYGQRRSVLGRPFLSALHHLTHLLTEEVPEAERLHYCRYARTIIDRIADGNELPSAFRYGWDNPDRADTSPVADRVPGRVPTVA